MENNGFEIYILCMYMYVKWVFTPVGAHRGMWEDPHVSNCIRRLELDTWCYCQCVSSFFIEADSHLIPEHVRLDHLANHIISIIYQWEPPLLGLQTGCHMWMLGFRQQEFQTQSQLFSPETRLPHKQT